MTGEERRTKIIEILRDSEEPVSGAELAKRLHVSRQVIVQDIALLRAVNRNIISTTKGYVLYVKEVQKVNRCFLVRHSDDEIEDELCTIVDNGGKVMDVVPRLMDDAERLGGDQCDNLTMLAMAWHDSYDTPAVEGSVSTKTLPLDRHTTVMEGFANRPQQEWDEADIERAIQEINSAIKKFSK